MNTTKAQAIRNAIHTNKIMTLKHLTTLLYLHAAALGISLINFLPIPYNLITWINRILSAGTLFCLLSLAAITPGYRLAGWMRAVVLGQNIIFALLPAPVLFSWYHSTTSLMIVRVGSGIVMVLTWLAIWFEYNSHAVLASVTSKGLAKWWIILFVGGLLVSVLGTAISWGVAYRSRGSISLNTVNFMIDIASKVVDVLYIWILYKLIVSIRTESV